DTGVRARFDFGSAIPTSFVFTPDGRALYVSSYYTGVSNVFRYDLAPDSMTTYSGAYTPLRHITPTTAYPIVEGYKDRVAYGARVNLSDPVGMHAINLSA